MPSTVTRHLIYRFKHHQADEQGFTLIEALVVIVVMTVLSALAVPTMLTQVNKAKESEAKTHVSAINRAQQAYFVQYGSFAPLANLELGIATSTQNYVYASVPAGASALATADTTATPIAAHSGVRGFAGKAWIGSTGGGVSALTIVCEGDLGSVPVIVGTTCP